MFSITDNDFDINSDISSQPKESNDNKATILYEDISNKLEFEDRRYQHMLVI